MGGAERPQEQARGRAATRTHSQEGTSVPDGEALNPLKEREEGKSEGGAERKKDTPGRRRRKDTAKMS